MKVFSRAAVRGGIDLRYSEGFNPRPRLSLPLPKSVGVETDDDLLALVVNCADDDLQSADRLSRIEKALSAQLPAGCEVISLDAATGKKPPRPLSALYVFAVGPEHVNDELRTRIENLLASESLIVRRHAQKRGARSKDVDVRSYIKSVELGDHGVFVECLTSPAGSIRMEEILELLDLDVEKLVRPIRRTNVKWQQS